jgi:2-oxoisovalerate dehydrogenase E1 component subunit alpha
MDDSSQMIGKAHPGASPRPLALRDPLPLELHVPAAPHRPGDSPQFDPLPSEPGDLGRPDSLAPHDALAEHAGGLIRVLSDEGEAAGPWNPQLSPQQLRNGLEMMLRARHFDARMIAMQRQGRLSFHVSGAGEEAASVAAALAYAPQDMLYPSYRQPGLLLMRGMPLLALMCQSIGNRFDNAKGRQMPVHYSWRASNVVSISSPVGTQFPQAVGAAMAFAYRGERRVVGSWIGDGTTAQGDFHYALNFASVFKPPCVLHVVDNQWAISTHRVQGTGGTTFAARAGAYRLPGLRVDGNDFLAVQGAEMWAVERARRGGGPTLVELVTYRRDAHSTSDDPGQYRAANEADSWPGGLGEWSEESHGDLDAGLEQEAAATFQQAEAFGSYASGLGHAPESLFEDVYATMPPHLRSQLSELQAMPREEMEDGAILPFKERKQRAAG